MARFAARMSHVKTEVHILLAAQRLTAMSTLQYSLKRLNGPGVALCVDSIHQEILEESDLTAQQNSALSLSFFQGSAGRRGTSRLVIRG